MSADLGASGGAEQVGGVYRMPSLGADMTGGRVVEWLVEPGDLVHRGDVVGVVDTDKGAIEMEIWEDAVVEEIVIAVGQKVPVGDVLLRLRPAEGVEAPIAGEPVTEPRPVAQASPEPRVGEPGRADRGPRRIPAPGARVELPGPRASPAAKRRARELGVSLEGRTGSGPDGAVVVADVERLASQVGVPEAPPPATGAQRWPAGEIHATPLARRVAESLGVDLSSAVGHGPGGLVTRADVEAMARPELAPRKAPPRREPTGVAEGGAEADAHDAMRRAIAAAMARSKREIPHYYLSTTASMRHALEWLAQQNRERAPEERLLLVSLFLKAVVVALRRVPELNGHWLEGGFRRSDAIHAGVAVSLRGGGLIAPAIRDTDQRSVADLSQAVVELVNRARSGRLRSSELTEGTITVSSMGDRGVDALFGIIYPPQVALVGVGRVAERPWAEGGMLGVHPVVELTLSADHRASDGHRGGVFLQAVVDLLQHPEEL